MQGEEDKIKTADAPEDNKEKLDSLWASFKDVTESKEVKEPVTLAVNVPTTSKVYEFAGEKIEYYILLIYTYGSVAMWSLR